MKFSIHLMKRNTTASIFEPVKIQYKLILDTVYGITFFIGLALDLEENPFILTMMRPLIQTTKDKVAAFHIGLYDSILPTLYAWLFCTKVLREAFCTYI